MHGTPEFVVVHVGSLPRPHYTLAITTVTFIIILELSESSLVVNKACKKILTDLQRYCTKVQVMKTISLR
jgi:hypothetical protein